MENKLDFFEHNRRAKAVATIRKVRKVTKFVPIKNIKYRNISHKYDLNLQLGKLELVKINKFKKIEHIVEYDIINYHIFIKNIYNLEYFNYLLNKYKHFGYKWLVKEDHKSFLKCINNNFYNIVKNHEFDLELVYNVRKCPSDCYRDLYLAYKQIKDKKFLSNERRLERESLENYWSKLREVGDDYILDYNIRWCSKCESNVQDAGFHYLEHIKFKPKAKIAVYTDEELIDEAIRTNHHYAASYFNMNNNFPERDSSLMLRLRNIIDRLANIRMGKRIYEEIELPEIGQEPIIEVEKLQETAFVEPQMDRDVTVDSVLEHGTAQIVQPTGSESVVVEDILNDAFWFKSAIDDRVSDVDYLTERPMWLGSFSWKSNIKFDEFIPLKDGIINLPFELFDTQFRDPGLCLMMTHAYWRGDMKVIIHLDTNSFCAGSLIFAFYYGADYDGLFSTGYRNSIASLVQMPHVIVDANSSEDVEMLIPYKSHRPCLTTIAKTQESRTMYLGVLMMKVISPLRTKMSSNAIDGTVSIQLMSNKYAAPCANSKISQADFVQPEMLAIKSIVKTAERVTNVLDNVINGDKPNFIQPIPQYILSPTDSIATGVNDVQNVNPLRLDPSSQTPHPVGTVAKNDTMNINSIARRIGFLAKKYWETNQASGKSIYSVAATPILDMTQYHGVTYSIDGIEFTGRILPPVSNIAMMNAYWRGALDYHIKIRNTMHHNGSLIFAYLPLVSEDKAQNMTVSELKCYYHSIVSIGVQNEFIFRVPFISDKQYYPRYYNYLNSESYKLDSPGTFVIKVVNRLVTMASVDTSVDIEIYISGGDNFEVAVPAAPLVSPLLDSKLIHPTIRDVYLKQGYDYSIGIGTWRFLPNGKAIMRYDSRTDHVSQFTPVQQFSIYTVAYDSTIKPMMWIKPGATATKVIPRYYCRVIINGDKNSYQYMTPFYERNDADRYIKRWQELQSQSPTLYCDSPTNLLQSIDASQNEIYVNIPQGSHFILRAVVSAEDEDSEIEILPNSDPMLLAPYTPSLVGVQQGKLLFGESFTSLKDYGRRYQFYGHVEVKLNKTDDKNYKLATQVRIPITPIGLEIDNTCANSRIGRLGMIPYITSAFRYFRGGLRFKIVLITNVSVIVMVQHRPDAQIENRNVIITQNQPNKPGDVLLSGYAPGIWSSSVNNIYSLETPYYNVTEQMLLQVPNVVEKSEVTHYSLGELALSIMANNPNEETKWTAELYLYYAFADDVELNCFVGFPPCMSLKDSIKLEPQMDVTPIEVDPQGSAISTMQEFSDQGLQHLVKQVSDNVQLSTENKITECSESIRRRVLSSLFDKLKSVVVNNVDDFSFMKVIKDVMSDFNEEYRQPIAVLQTQLAHCFLGFTQSVWIGVAHCAIAMTMFCNTLITDIPYSALLNVMGDLCKLVYDKTISIIPNGLNDLDCGNSDCSKDGECPIYRLYSEEDAYDDDYSDFAIKHVRKSAGKTEKALAKVLKSLASIIMDTISGVSKNTKHLILSMIDSISSLFSIRLFRNIKDISMSINSVFTLFRNLLIVFKDLYTWIMGKLRKTEFVQWLWSKEERIVQFWMDDVEALLNPVNADLVHYSRSVLVKMELCWAVGLDITQRITGLGKQLPIKNPTYLLRLFAQLCAKRNDMVKSNLHASTKIKPFVFCFYGDSQIGKTHASQEIALQLLSSINYKCYGQPIYTVPGAAKHWTGCANQPICVFDDFMVYSTFEGNEVLASEISNLFGLVGNLPFNPPMAAVEDKSINYSPLVVCINCNSHNVKLDQLSHEDAWKKRRQNVIKVSLKPEYSHVSSASEIDESIVRQFGHLQFQIHRRPEHSCCNKEKIMDYNEFKTEIISRFKTYHEKAKKQFLREVLNTTKFEPDMNNTLSQNVQYYIEYLSLYKNPLPEIVKRNQEGLLEQCQKCFNIQCNCEVIAQGFVNDISRLDCIHKVVISDNYILEQAEDDNYYYFHPYNDFVAAIPVSKCEASCLLDSKSFYTMLISHLRKQGVCESIYSSLYNYEDYIKVLESETPTKSKNKLIKMKYKRCKDTGKFDKSYRDSITQRLFGISSTVYDVMITSIKIFGGVIAMYASFTVGESMMNKWFTGDSKNFFRNSYVLQSQMPYDESTKIVRQQQKLQSQKKFARPVVQAAKPESSKNKIKVVDTLRVESQMASEKFRVIKEKLIRNTFHIVAVTVKDNKFVPGASCRCLGLANHSFIALDHYYHEFDTYEQDVQYWYFQGDVKLHIPSFKDIVNQSYKFDGSAIRISQLPHFIPPFKDITKFIVSSKNLDNISKSIYVMEINRISDNTVVNVHKDVINDCVSNLSVPSTNPYEPNTQIESLITYNTSGRGLCGSVVIIDTNNIGCILGIHVAGLSNNTVGYAEVIERENILSAPIITQQIFETSDTIEYKGVELVIPNMDNPLPYLEGVHEYIGTTTQKYSHNSPKVSKQVETLCNGVITDVTYALPILSLKDERAVECPMIEGCSYHCEPPLNFDLNDVEEAYVHLNNKILSKCKPIRYNIGVLTVEQAIIGIPEYTSFAPMELSTSEGFPFKADRPANFFDKKWLIEINEQADYPELISVHPSVTQMMEYKHQQRIKGIIPFTVFVDCLKDLKLPAEKPNARIFSISPVDFTIQFRQYFYDFCTSYQEARFNVESAIGINVDSVEWSAMVYKLLAKSSRFVCGDYSKFGPRLMSICAMKAFDIIRNWYKFYSDVSFEDDVVRQVMGYETCFSIHQMNNYLYRVFCGAPSGSPITTILNNLVNCLYLRVAYINIMKENFIKSYNLYTDSNLLINHDILPSFISSYDLAVCNICYGDDEIMTVHEEYNYYYNTHLLSFFFSKYWIKFTDAKKTGVYSTYSELMDEATSFLKRNIGKHEFRFGIYVAKMDKRAIEETCNWCFKQDDMLEASKVACQAMLVNAHGHGSVYYNNLRNRVLEYWQKRNEYIIIPTWKECDVRIYDYDM